MREIKFKGKRIDNGNWIEGYIVKGKCNDFYIVNDFSEEWNDENGVFIDADYFEVIPKTVRQYTGLKDTNGKEIYEGDIIKHLNGDIFHIIFSEIVPWFVFQEKDGIEYLPSIEDYSELEVIGNMYENLELLK